MDTEENKKNLESKEEQIPESFQEESDDRPGNSEPESEAESQQPEQSAEGSAVSQDNSLSSPGEEVESQTPASSVVSSSEEHSKDSETEKQGGDVSPAEQERLAMQEDVSITGSDDDEDDDDESDDDKDDDLQDQEEEETSDLSSLSKDELLQLMQAISEVDDALLRKNKRKAEDLREAFMGLIKEEQDKAFAHFLETGGDRKDYKELRDKSDDAFFKAYKRFTTRRFSLRKKEEKQREENLRIKRDLLEQMKTLIQNEENIERAYNEFHRLRDLWSAAGPIPARHNKDIGLTYKHYIDGFYNLININRELRELDQKRNLEIKLKICEEAEDLLIEPNMNRALSTLRSLQKRWRESGFVDRSKGKEIWERFKSAVDKIYLRRDEYRERMKSSFAENAQARELLIQQAKAFAAFKGDSHHDWKKKQEEVIELQRLWREAGMVDKEQSAVLWKQFRAECDTFFNNKNDFYKERKKEFLDNLQKKKELCIQAEALMNSEDWRGTTEEYKKLQAEWKKTGPVSEKYSNQIWHRFRKACDGFFKNKAKHFASREEDQEENYKKKLLILDEVEKLKLGEDMKANLNVLKDYQRKWAECGMVPLKKKADLQSKLRKAIDKHFDNLTIDDSEKRKIMFDQKIERLKNASDGGTKIKEQQKMISSKLRNLKNDVALWENNIGFFANTKNAKSLIDEFDEKISKAKEEIEILKEQLQMIKK